MNKDTHMIVKAVQMRINLYTNIYKNAPTIFSVEC